MGIDGFATPEETSAYAKRHKLFRSTALPDTGLVASPAGFGCYRVSAEVPHHARALGKALLEGINLIDTSANYADGGSETLVGRVIGELIAAGRLSRGEVIVVSKVGYLQGQNYALSRQREQQGRPFPEVVPYGKGLAHCMHPEFLQDQLDRSLARLNLDTIDFYLLHNPEYYLDWAHKNGLALEAARAEYYRRVKAAFAHLEEEVQKGRIRYYGISSNTFPAPADNPEFTCLATVLGIAESTAALHQFRLVQFPMNLLEAGAVLERNQPDGESVLQLAHRRGLGVLINRPLNAFTGNRLIRLAEPDGGPRQSRNEIIEKISAVGKSEKRFWRKLLPDLELMPGLNTRIKEQLAVSETLTHHWLNFGSYEHWRQTQNNVLMPRVNGVMNFLGQHAADVPAVGAWMQAHRLLLESALAAVGSIYAEAAALQAQKIRQALAAADADWARGGTLSQKAVRAAGSTTGVSCVLVGMRRERYVADILEEAARDVRPGDRTDAWASLQAALAGIIT
jgi:aryl-alcohol dehydrogenase-like predicted oxidoreductase